MPFSLWKITLNRHGTNVLVDICKNFKYYKMSIVSGNLSQNHI